MSDSFICSICGEEHEGLITDWAYKLPDVVWEIPEAERTEKARFNDDLCQLAERYFIRCVLHVPIAGAPESFGWGAWAEVDLRTFERYLEIYDEDGSYEPKRPGTLANELRPYPGSLGAPVVIEFRDPTKRPSLHLKPDNGTLLAGEQRFGIDEGRFHEILHVIRR